jgi:hypothetical protein
VEGWRGPYRLQGQSSYQGHHSFFPVRFLRYGEIPKCNYAALVCGGESSFSGPKVDSYSATTRLSMSANRFAA